MATATMTEAPTLTSASATSSSSCTTAVPGKYGHVPYDSCNSNYSFDPSFGGNLAFLVLFSITTVAHLIEAIVFKKVGFGYGMDEFICNTDGVHICF